MLWIFTAALCVKIDKNQQAYDIYSMLRKRKIQKVQKKQEAFIQVLIVWFNQIHLLYKLQSEIYSKKKNITITNYLNSNKIANEINKLKQIVKQQYQDQEQEQESQFIKKCILSYLPLIVSQYTPNLQGYIYGLCLYLKYNNAITEWLIQFSIGLLEITSMQIVGNDYLIEADGLLNIIKEQIDNFSEFKSELLLDGLLKGIFIKMVNKSKDISEMLDNQLVLQFIDIIEKILNKEIKVWMNLQMWFNIVQICQGVNNQKLPTLIMQNCYHFQISSEEISNIFNNLIFQQQVKFIYLTGQLIFRTQKLNFSQIQIILQSLIPYCFLSQYHLSISISYLKSKYEVQRHHHQNHIYNLLITAFLASSKLFTISNQLFIAIIESQYCIKKATQLLPNLPQELSHNLINKCYEIFLSTYSGLEMIIVLCQGTNNVIKFDIIQQIIQKSQIDFSFTQNFVNLIFSLLRAESSQQIFRQFIQKNLQKIQKKQNKNNLSQIQQFRQSTYISKMYKLLIIIFIYNFNIRNLNQKVYIQSECTLFLKKSNFYNHKKYFVILKYLKQYKYQQQQIFYTEINLLSTDPINLLLLIAYYRNNFRNIPIDTQITVKLLKYMNYSNQNVQCLAILIYLYLLKCQQWKKWKNIVRQMLLSNEKIKKKYLQIRFDEKIIHQLLSQNIEKQSIINHQQLARLKQIQITLLSFIRQYFGNQLKTPKQPIFINQNCVKPHQITQEPQLQEFYSQSQQIQDYFNQQKLKIQQNIRESHPIKNEDNPISYRFERQKYKKQRVSFLKNVQRVINQRKKKKYHQKPEKVDLKSELAVKISLRDQNRKNKNYYIGLRQLKNQWKTQLNLIHRS